MIYGSVCSGIEAASVAWHPLGWTPAFFSEIDAFPRAVLSHHFPEVPLHGDFTTIQPGDYRPIDLLVGGTPCQSFSIAGLRKGLDDDRGNLALEYLRLADRLRPQWLVWENVPGVLSSNGGRDFGAFLGGLVELGYGFAYRVLDAQFFGVAQRRRRVFVVAYLGDWRPAAAVLFERHSLQGHPAPRRGQGAGVAAAAEGGAGDGGGAVQPFEVANCLTARMHKGINTTVDEGQTPVVVNALTATGVGTCGADDNPAQAGHLLPMAFDTAQITSAANGTRVSPELPASTLAKGSRMHVAYEPYTLAIRGREGGADLEHRQDGTSNAILTPSGGRAGIGVGAVAVQGPSIGRQDNAGPQGSGVDASGAMFTLTKTDVHAVATAMRVRRLTPTECERLQGFPEVQETAMFAVCSDQQKADALAALKCPKSQSNVWIADAAGWRLSVEAAEHHSNTNLPDLALPVAVDVLINLEQSAVEIRSPVRSFSSASSASGKNSSHLPMPLGDFVHLVALTRQGLANKTPVGKAASLQGNGLSTLGESGAVFALASGSATEEPVGGVKSIISEASRHTTFTTSHLTQNTPISDLTLKTLCCCVNRAMLGFIPQQIKNAPFYVIRLTVRSGWTQVPYRNKPAADGPRYKALGNSMAVPVMAWIGQRIAEVSSIISLKEAA